MNADPPAHDLCFQKESFKSGLIQYSSGCDRQLCCWVLSLPMLQDKALLCPLLQEERKWVLTPSCTVDALQYMDNAESLSRGLTHRPQECSAPNPEHWPPPWKLPVPWAIPLQPGILSRLMPHQAPRAAK